MKFPMRKVPSLYQEENILITRDWELTPKWICTNKPTKITFVLPPLYFLVTVPQFTAPGPSHILIIKRHISFFGPNGSFRFSFSFEDSHMHIKILNKMYMFSPIKLSYVSLLFRSNYRTWEGRENFFLPYNIHGKRYRLWLFPPFLKCSLLCVCVCVCGYDTYTHRHIYTHI